MLFDVAGYYADGDRHRPGSRFHSMQPTAGDGHTRRHGRHGPGAIGGGQTARLQLGGLGRTCRRRASAPSPSTSRSPSPTSPSFVTVFPSDVGQPTVSNLNFTSGTTIANQVIVRLPADGSVEHLQRRRRDPRDRRRRRLLRRCRGRRARSLHPVSAVPRHRHPRDQSVPRTRQPRSSYLLYYVSARDGAVPAYRDERDRHRHARGSGIVTAFPYSDTSSVAPLASTLNYSPGRTVPNHAIIAHRPARRLLQLRWPGPSDRRRLRLLHLTARASPIVPAAATTDAP